jgi:hydrogenase/urease accessory protein HupE
MSPPLKIQTAPRPTLHPTAAQRGLLRGAPTRLRWLWLWLWLMVLPCLLSGNAWAHKTSDAYLQLSQRADATHVTSEVALRDLDRALNLDSNQDAALQWGEVRGRWAEIAQLVQQGVRLHSRDLACQAQLTSPPQLVDHSDGAYAVLTHVWRCPVAQPATHLSYTLFQNTDASHRGLIKPTGLDSSPRLLVPGAAPVALDEAAPSAALAARTSAESSAESSNRPSNKPSNMPSTNASTPGWWPLVWAGVHHIAVGLDHILFLLTLLLVAVFTRQDKRWLPQPSARAAVLETLRIVTSFTVAHSITLGLAAAGWLTPPARLIESVIALSVLLAATDNLRQIFFLPRWLLAGLFGWFHGFGFATPLQDLGLQGTALLLPLLAFNLGVELGQLAIVALVLPLALAWRQSARYKNTWVPGLSLGVAALACLWLVERSLDVSLLGP